MRVRLYSNRDLVVPGLDLCMLLFPFWGKPIFQDSAPYAEATFRYGYQPRDFELVESVGDADYYLIPHDFWQLKARNERALQKMIEEAQEAKKPILIDASGDVSGRIDLPQSVVLRLNQYRGDLPQNEITVPFPCEDLLESYGGGKIQLRSKGEKPVIGFVGWGKFPIKQRLRTLIKELPYRIFSLIQRRYVVYQKGVFWRERALEVFSAASRVTANFVIRPSYSASAKTLQGDPKANREEFVKNILDSDYTLAVKGDANSTVRFYETLSLGRIPVLIDTEVVLPLEDLINYREFCVIIDYKDLKHAPEILADFHAKLSKEDFIAMQQKARYVFEHYLRYDAFSQYLAETLHKHKQVTL